MSKSVNNSLTPPRFTAILRESAAEQKKPQTLVVTAMMIAMNIALSSVHVYLTPQMRVGFGFLTNAITGMLYGPVVAATAGAVGDVLSYLIRPDGAYFPGFTITAALGGLIYGFLLYRRPMTLPRAIVAKSSISLLLNVLLNTFWMVVLYGKSFTALFPVRLTKNLMLLPVEIVLLYIIGKTVQKISRRIFAV